MNAKTIDRIDLFDNDLYKFKMQQAILELFPSEKVEYTLFFRDGVEYPYLGFLALREFVYNKSSYKNSYECLSMFERDGSFKGDYINFLRVFNLDCNDVDILYSHGHLHVTVTGLWWKVIHWEVILMSIISEFYYLFGNDHEVDMLQQSKSACIKSNECSGMNVTEMGTRRRYSKELQSLVVSCLTSETASTSNVLFSNCNHIPCVGTVAHEWYMFHTVHYGAVGGINKSLSNWLAVYPDNPGYILPDTLGTEAFLRHADPGLVVKFKGFRQDSGDPIAFLNRIYDYYKTIGADPSSRSIMFSDSLNIYKAIKIKEACDRLSVPCFFGIGTHFTNDIPDVKPLNMVIKMTRASSGGRALLPTVKISDVQGKETGNKFLIESIKKDVLS